MARESDKKPGIVRTLLVTASAALVFRKRLNTGAAAEGALPEIIGDPQGHPDARLFALGQSGKNRDAKLNALRAKMRGKGEVVSVVSPEDALRFAAHNEPQVPLGNTEEPSE